MSFAELWDWRRRVAELYAAARAEADPQAGWLLWRERRDALYREHPQSPLDPEARAGFARLPFFPYDPSLRFLARLVPIEEAAEEQFGAGADGTVRLRPFARTDGLQAKLGGELTLYWMLGYCGGVFLPFADATSGRETYGAGRYVLDTIKSADLGSAPDGRAILDFNFAYNPSCAYSARWACPLAPAANRLPEPVRAGEKSPGPLHGPV
jgi:uncharacterized protein (DUF1684 family)